MECWGDDTPTDALSINASFAAAFDRSAARAAAQRKADLVSSVPIPAAVLSAFISSLDKAGGGLGPSWPAHRVARAVVAEHRLRLEPPAAALLGEGARGSGGEADRPTTLAAFLAVGGAGRGPVTKLLRWVRGQAHVARKTWVAAVVAPGGSGLGNGAPLARKRPREGDAPPPIMPRARAATTAPIDVHQGVRLPRPAPNDGRKGGAAPVSAPPQPTCAPIRQHLAPPPVHVHGRGAGAGRGLDHTGEPHFCDLHPSWAPRRKLARRSAKIVTRALREDHEVVLVQV